ncbi:hypothetical protein A2U01_0089146, partial [Trifolium medium]|nr:hypothetical protein [Trifolium medium]
MIEDLIRSGHLRKFLEDAAKGHVALLKQERYPPKKEGGEASKRRVESPLTQLQEDSQEEASRTPPESV